MKYLLLLSLVGLIGIGAYMELHLRNPTCPRCRNICWTKHLFSDWQCQHCAIWYNPVHKTTSWRPILTPYRKGLL